MRTEKAAAATASSVRAWVCEWIVCEPGTYLVLTVSVCEWVSVLAERGGGGLTVWDERVRRMGHKSGRKDLLRHVPGPEHLS